MSCCQNTVCWLHHLHGRREAVTVNPGTSNDIWHWVLARISPAWLPRAALFHLSTAGKDWPSPVFHQLTRTAPQPAQLLPAEPCIQQGSSHLLLLLRSSWIFLAPLFPALALRGTPMLFINQMSAICERPGRSQSDWFFLSTWDFCNDQLSVISGSRPVSEASKR